MQQAQSDESCPDRDERRDAGTESVSRGTLALGEGGGADYGFVAQVKKSSDASGYAEH
jgi:hypothetical protein